MKNNETQIKSEHGDNLPIVSDKKEIQRNSMRLYIYLVSISDFNGRNQPRILRQKNICVKNIKEALGMHPDTIKKYWRLLEEHSLIKYEGPAHPEMDWKKVFTIRRKDGATYYTIPKKTPYRIIPRETISKMQDSFLVNEKELKIYLLLAEMQERFCYLSSPERNFTIADLRELLHYTNQEKINKELLACLVWLKELGLIEYKIMSLKKSNLGYDIPVFNLISVNYYTSGGDIAKALQAADVPVVSEDIKKDILQSKEIVIFDNGQLINYDAL